MSAKNSVREVNKKPLVLLTLLISIFLITGAYLYYNYQAKQISKEAKRNLDAISKLKIDDIAQWRKERLSEAEFFPGNEIFIANTKKLLDTKDSSLFSFFSRTLEPIKKNHGYDNIFIASPGGKIIYSIVPKDSIYDTLTLKAINNSILQNKILFNDFYYCTKHKKVHLQIVSPVVYNGTPIAAMVLSVDPTTYLYPLIESWPVSSKTAETLIYRVENGNVLFLNMLRHQKNPELDFKIPLSKKEVIAVKGALGYQGVTEGIDYRDEEVLAAVYKIKDSNWYMVAKVDRAEAYEGIWYTALAVTVIVAVLILLAITALTLLYESKQKKLYREMTVKDRNLAETLEEFRTTLYSIGDAVITTDLNGCVKYMNTVAEELTGWGENEAMGKFITDVFDIKNEDTHETVVSPVQRVLEEGIIVGLANHTILISKNGEEIPIADSGSPIKDSSGNIIGVVLVFRDQSSEREAEKKLRESEERYKSIFRNAHTIMLLVDPENGNIIDANPAAVNYYGYSYNEITKLQVWHLNQLPPKRVLERMAQAINSDITQFQFTHKLADGRVRNVEVFSGPISFNGRKVLYSIVHDITERKKSEEALRISEEKFSRAFTVSPDAVNINRLSDGLYYDVNKGFCDVTGYSREEVIGKTSIELNIWADPKDRAKLVQGIKEFGQVSNLEAKFRTKDGSIVTGLMSASIINIDGEDYLLNITRDITERKKAEEALRISEERLRLFVEHAPAAIAMLDKEMKYMSVSKRWLKDYLAEERDITGLSHYVVFPQLPEKWKEIHRRCLAGSTEKCEEDIMPYADGRQDWIRWEIHPWKNEKNEIGGIILFSEVITERKKAEEAIKEKNKLEEQISRIVVTAPGGLCSFSISRSKEFSVNFVSPKWEELFALTKEDIIRNPEVARARIHPEDIEPLIKELKESAAQKRNVVAEYRIINPNKGLIWVEGRFSVSIENDGSVTWQGFVTNITERKLAEERINKLSRGIEQSPVIVIITDTKGNIEYVNPKFTEVTGYELEEVKGKNPSILKSGYKSKEEYSELWKTILSKKEWHGEFLNRKKNGELYWESASISPLLNENGEVISFIAVKEDITDLKKMTDELIDAKEKAEEMNRVKTNFFANVSHELRTPFVGIIGFSELLSERLHNPEEKKMAEVILSSSKRLTDTLNKILDISKLEFDKIEVNLKETDIFHLVENLYHLYSKSAEKRNTKLKFEFNTTPLIWNTDGNLLREVIGNLINNAVKFTSDGEITIFTGVYPEDGNRNLIIKVADTGVGIPKDKQEIIWQEFRQASEGYSRSFEGTGLGLSITKRYVELLGGSITLESDIDKGAVFTLIFPENSNPGQNPEEEITVVTEVKRNVNIKSENKSKILYIEDDPVSTEYIKKVLSKYYKIDFADDAESAMQYVEKEYYGIIMLDINLGYGMNGIELVQKIREIPSYSNTPIIAVTAYASSSNKREFLSKGFSHYISKPFTSKEIIELLEEIEQNAEQEEKSS